MMTLTNVLFYSDSRASYGEIHREILRTRRCRRLQDTLNSYFCSLALTLSTTATRRRYSSNKLDRT